MTDTITTPTITTPARSPHEATLELDFQELEAMEAPGFWTGFFVGGKIAIGMTAITFAFT